MDACPRHRPQHVQIKMLLPAWVGNTDLDGPIIIWFNIGWLQISIDFPQWISVYSDITCPILKYAYALAEQIFPPRNKRVNEKAAECIKWNKLSRTYCAHGSGAKSNYFEKLSDAGVWWFLQSRYRIENTLPWVGDCWCWVCSFNWDLIRGCSPPSAVGSVRYLWVDAIPDVVTQYVSLFPHPHPLSPTLTSQGNTNGKLKLFGKLENKTCHLFSRKCKAKAMDFSLYQANNKVPEPSMFQWQTEHHIKSKASKNKNGVERYSSSFSFSWLMNLSPWRLSQMSVIADLQAKSAFLMEVCIASSQFGSVWVLTNCPTT